jgi:hypothetical protein
LQLSIKDSIFQDDIQNHANPLQSGKPIRPVMNSQNIPNLKLPKKIIHSFDATINQFIFANDPTKTIFNALIKTRLRCIKN